MLVPALCPLWLPEGEKRGARQVADLDAQLIRAGRQRADREAADVLDAGPGSGRELDRGRCDNLPVAQEFGGRGEVRGASV